MVLKQLFFFFKLTIHQILYEFNKLFFVLQTVDHTATQERHEALKEEVRRMITDAEDKPVQKLRLIDEVQRLGVAYHFEKEIEDAIQKLCPNYIHSNSPDLHTVSLHFRLLRQQGIKISCGM